MTGPFLATLVSPDGIVRRAPLTLPDQGYAGCSIRFGGARFDITARRDPFQTLSTLFDALGGSEAVGHILGLHVREIALIRGTSLDPRFWQALLQSEPARALGLTADHLVLMHAPGCGEEMA